MDEKYVEVDGERVFYRQVETGEVNTVLLLHGMRFSSENWVEIDALRKINQLGFNVIAIDYPGFGKSPGSKRFSISSGGFSASSELISSLCDVLGIEEVILVGPSMGGGIALRTLLDNPKLVKETIVIAPAGFDEFRSDLYRIDSPVHIIWGTDDSTIDISYGRRFHDLISGSSLHAIKGADHTFYMKKTTQFFSLIKKLLLHE